MAERHDLPGKPADDGVHAIKERRLHGLVQEFNLPKGSPEFHQWVRRRLLRPEGLVDGSRVDEGKNAYRLAGSRDVFAVKEGAGPVLDRVIVRYLGVPVTLAAVESYTAACCHRATSYCLAAAEKAVLEVVYSRRYT